ncbi:hypothetical protein H0H93_006994 [Arthromyces matolae]|nr:hypothetical protein H0H93_006994 [Arthromyces matolae]
MYKRTDESSNKLRVVGFNDDTKNVLRDCNPKGEDYIEVAWSAMDTLTLLVPSDLPEFLASHVKQHAWTRLTPGSTESPDMLEKAKAEFHLIEPQPSSDWKTYVAERQKDSSHVLKSLAQSSGEDLPFIYDKIEEAIDNAISFTDLDPTEADIRGAEIFSRIYSPYRTGAVDVYLDYWYRTRYESVEFFCTVWYRPYSTVSQPLKRTVPQSEKKPNGFKKLFQMGLKDMPPGRRWRAVEERTFDILEFDVSGLHRILFGEQLQEPTEAGYNKDALSERFGKADMIELMLASVGISFRAARDKEEIDSYDMGDMTWEGLRGSDRDQTYAAGSAIVQPNILSQNFNNGPVLQQHSLVDRQKNNIAIQRHNPYSRLTSFHHSRSTRGGRNTAHNQPPQSRQAFMSNGVAQIYPASGNTTQFPTTIGNESTPDLGSGYLSTSTVVMQPSAGGVSNPQQVPIRRSASMSISQSQPPLGNIVRVHSYVGLNPSEFATGGVAHDEATTAYFGSRWPQPQLLPSQNIEKPSIYSNIGHFYGRNLVQPSSRNSIPPTKQATTVDANAQYIWIPDAITNIVSTAVVSYKNHYAQFYQSSQPLAGSAGSSQSTTHFSQSYQIGSGNAYQLSQSLAGGTAPSQAIAYFSRPYQGASSNASQNEVQLPQDGDEPLSTQPVGNTLPAQQSFTAPQVTGNGSTATGVAQNPSLFGSGTAFPAYLFPWEGKTVLDPNCSQCYPNRDNTVLSGNDNKTNRNGLLNDHINGSK